MKQEKLESITPLDNELPPTKKTPEKKEHKASRFDEDLENMKRLTQENRDRIYREREIAKQRELINSDDNTVLLEALPKEQPVLSKKKETTLVT